MQRLHERYRVIERIGDGGAGAVYRVEDEATGQIRAMKVLPRAAAGGGLRGEFLALARLRHDNVVSVFDYGLTSGGQDFFTMEYVVGPPLLAAASDVAPEVLFRLIGGVLRALAFVHARGMVHADIKPSNILVDGERLAEDPDRAARLADFGLAAHMTDPTSGAARGTFLYAAPEVFAGRLDARSDLYALGVVLYQMLTRQLPFPQGEVRALVAAQREGPPEDPRRARPDLPAGLAELVLALMDPAPGARPQTADEVLARINDIAGTRFAIADSRPLVDVGGVLFGRDRELAKLDGMWREAQAGAGGAALVRGERGVGVSRLLAEHRLAVQLAGGRTLSTSARDPALGGLARAGAGGAVAADGDARFARAEAAAEELFELAAGKPLLLVVDDLERAVAGTGELLAYLARAVTGSEVLLVLGHSGDAGGEPSGEAAGVAAAAPPVLRAALADLPPARRLELAPLGRADLAELVAHAFSREIAGPLTGPLHGATGGNPGQAARALEALVESGQIARERGRWVLRDEAIEIAPPADAAAVAAARLDRLAPGARLALRAVSILGGPFDRELAAALCAELDGAPAEEAALGAALADAVALRLLEADAAAGRYEPLAAAAGALRGELSEEERARLHRRAAAILEARAAAGAPVRAGELARHHLAVADHGPGVRWARRAAEEHALASDPRGALDWYRAIEPLCEGEELAPVLERMGDQHARLGEIDRALEVYRRAHDLSREPVDRVRLAGLAAELLRRQGDGDRALEVLMGALELARQHELGAAQIQTHLRIGRVLWYRAEYKAALEHAVAGQLLARLRGDRRALADLARLEAQIAISRGDSRAALEHLEGALRDAEAVGEPLLTAQIQHEVGRAALHAGSYERAVRALEAALPVQRRAGHIERVAALLNNLGVAHYQRGEWAAAREAWEDFRRLCERLGERSELVFALNNLGILRCQQGELDGSMAALERAAALAQDTGHAHMAAMIAANRGEVLFRRGELAAAADCYARARGEFERMGARDDVVETARRQCELALTAGRVSEALDAIVDVARMARDAGARLEEGIAHRVAARALRMSGDLDSAVWFAERAGELLGALGAGYHLALLEAERGELSAARGDLPAARSQLQAAAGALAELGARWDLTQVRARLRALSPAAARSGEEAAGPGTDAAGFALLVDLARASSHQPLDRVLEQAVDSLLAVTGYDRGFLLLIDQEGQPRERTRRVRPGTRGFARDEADFSGSIVRKVAVSGQAVAMDDIAREVDLRQQRSVIALGLRRAMCAPLRARGRTLGVAYVDSQSAPGEDRPVSLELFEAFTGHVALLVDNARLEAEDGRKSELMAVLAHEIRNPLAAILGFAEIGREDSTAAPADDAADLFDRIHRDGERLRRLVDNIMELVRHDTGKLDWSSTTVDMHRLLTAAVESFEPMCRDKQIEVQLDLDGLDVRAFGNEDRLMQVVSNLLTNAYKFTRRGGRITISARREEVPDADPASPPVPASELRAWTPLHGGETREMVRVDVTDTGAGMTEEECRRLFAKFVQGGRQGRSAGGLGLGLYISREIIDRHGGAIWATSKPGEGATFSFRIPTAP